MGNLTLDMYFFYLVDIKFVTNSISAELQQPHRAVSRKVLPIVSCEVNVQ